MMQTVTNIGPKDNGRRMSLSEFEPAHVEDGYNYELGRGVVVVSDVPKLRHQLQVNAVRNQFVPYHLKHPDRIFTLCAGNECKILLADLESERHPDLAVYFMAPPVAEDFWALWIPDIAVEVVSPGSEQRDYVEKREEYFDFGVKEYWIVDADKQEVLVLRRSRGKWVELVLRPGDIYETKLLPAFKFDCRQVFEAAARA